MEKIVYLDIWQYIYKHRFKKIREIEFEFICNTSANVCAWRKVTEKWFPVREIFPGQSCTLFGSLKAICSHPIEETLPETDMIRNCFLFSSLSSRKVGRRLRKRLPLPQWSTMQSTDGWMYLYTRVAWYVIFLNSLPCMYVRYTLPVKSQHS